MRVRAFAKINLSLRVLGIRDGRLPRAADDLPVDRAARYADDPRAPRGPFTLTCDDPACPADSTQSDLRARRWRCGRRPAAAARRAASRSISRNASRCRPGWAAAAATRPRRLRAFAKTLAGRAAIRSSPRPKRSAPTCRTSSKAARCSASSAAICCSVSPSRRRRGWCSSCPLSASARRTPSRGSTRPASRSAHSGRGLPAEARSADARAGQRSRSAGGGASSGNRPYHFGTPARRRIAGGDVGQRLGRIRPVFFPSEPRFAPQNASHRASRRTL